MEVIDMHETLPRKALLPDNYGAITANARIIISKKLSTALLRKTFQEPQKNTSWDRVYSMPGFVQFASIAESYLLKACALPIRLWTKIATVGFGARHVMANGLVGWKDRIGPSHALIAFQCSRLLPSRS